MNAFSAEVVRGAVTKLLHDELIGFDRLAGGRNSQVWRAVTRGGNSYAVKLYHRAPVETRDRLNTEFEALGFLRRHGIDNVPRPLHRQADPGLAVYEFIEGAAVPQAAVTAADIDALAALLLRLHVLRVHPEAASFAPASEAFFSWPEIIRHLEARLTRLRDALADDALSADCRLFLQNELAPAIAAAPARAKTQLDEAGLAWDTPLPEAARTLSPSDFGFHNALRRLDGSLAFLDFEYFGWDDPAKMIADFRLHPGRTLAPELYERFSGDLVPLFAASDRLDARLPVALRLFSLKWCLIILNAFIPEYAAARNWSEAEREEFRCAQLRQAKTRLEAER